MQPGVGHSGPFLQGLWEVRLVVFLAGAVAAGWGWGWANQQPGRWHLSPNLQGFSEGVAMVGMCLVVVENTKIVRELVVCRGKYYILLKIITSIFVNFTIYAESCEINKEKTKKSLKTA
jgi:hypothetical protein